MFEIIPIGINGAFTHKGFNTNYLVNSPGGKWLVDCGSTAGAALANLGEDLVHIDSIYISHLHLDHTGGLIESGYKRISLGLPKTKIYLHESMLPKFWDKLLSTAMGTEKSWEENSFFEFIPIAGSFQEASGNFEIHSTPLQAVKVKHAEGLSCHGLILDEKVFITTDCCYSLELLESLTNAYGLEAIIHDCSLFGGFENVHASYKQLQSAPDKIKQILMLSHVEDDPAKTGVNLEIPILEQGKAYSF